MNKEEFSIQLTRSGIDECSERVFHFLIGHQADRRRALRLRLNLENVLLDWRDALGEDAVTEVSCALRFGTFRIHLSCKGICRNPFLQEEDEFGNWVHTLRSGLEEIPGYRYGKGSNQVRFSLKRQSSRRMPLTFAFVIVGVLLGLAGRGLSAGFREMACAKVFTPLYETYLQLFSCVGLPLIFLSVVLGIVGIGDLNTFSRTGTKIIRSYLLLSLAAAVLTLCALPAFHLNFGSSALEVQFSGITSIVRSWLPDTLFSPLNEKNAMQLVLMGGVFAVAILRRNQAQGPFVQVMSSVNDLLLEISRWLTGLVPLFVAVTLVNSIWKSEITQILSAWKSWVITTGVQLGLLFVYMLWISFRTKTGVCRIIRKVSRTFLTALGTNSCTASIVENYNACSSKLGIAPQIFTAGIPIGTTVFKPATAVRIVLLSLFFAESCGLTVSAVWLILLVLLAVLFSIAVPAIPGGLLMFCPMLFAQLGLPQELAAQMLATDIFFDCICTACNQVFVQMVLLSHAAESNQVAEEVLKK